MDTYTPDKALAVNAGSVYTQGVELTSTYFITTQKVSISVDNTLMFPVLPYTKIAVKTDSTYKFDRSTLIILAGA